MAIIVVALATFIAANFDGQSGVGIPAAFIVLVAMEKRRNKVISASLIQISDEQGGIRGLIGYDGSGIQIGVRTDPIFNSATGYQVLWQYKPNVAFSCQAATSTSTSGVIDVAPEVWVRGQMQYEMRSYSLVFGYDIKANKPAINVNENLKESVVSRAIHTA